MPVVSPGAVQDAMMDEVPATAVTEAGGGAGARTPKETTTGSAAACVGSPACVAVMVQVPAVSSVTVEPLTVHTVAVSLAYDRASPDVAVPDRFTVPADNAT